MMFGGDDKSKSYVKLTLRVVVAGYIGFLGGQLIAKREPGSSIWFMVAAVFFILVAVGFIAFSIWNFFTEKRILENQDETDKAEKPELTDNGSDAKDGENISIRDMARYQNPADSDDSESEE